MIQILVCDKVYVTPEMKRKKLMYKIYFVISIFLVIALSSYYIYAEYDRNKSEEVSQEILQAWDDFDIPTLNIQESHRSSNVSVEDNVIVVVLNDADENEVIEEIKVSDLIDTTNAQISENAANNVAIPKVYKASNGAEYYIIAKITIPALGLEYPVLSTWDDNLLKNATCKFYGPNPNEIGNFCIIGHNYRNDKFFSKLETLSIRDTIEIQDMSGRIVKYAIYDKYVVEPTDMGCIDQNTNGKKEITLITCYNYGTQRTVIKATEIQ